MSYASRKFTKRPTSGVILAFAVAAVPAMLAVHPAAAATIDWIGTADQQWATAGNWNGGAAPANNIYTDEARFNLPDYTGKQPNLASNASVNGVIYGDGSTATGSLALTGQALFIGNGVMLEEGLAKAEAGLKERGHNVRIGDYASGLHIITLAKDGTLRGGADPRREGTVVGE